MITNMPLVIKDAEDQFGMHRKKGFDRKIKHSYDLSINNCMISLIYVGCNGCFMVSETLNYPLNLPLSRFSESG